MVTRKLIVNGYDEIELNSTTPIALTKRVNNISELRDVQASYISEFIAPDTHKNQVGFGLVNELGSRNAMMYRRVPAIYLEDDEMLIDGLCVITRYVKGVGFYLVVISAISDFFDVLGDSTLRDYDFGEYDFDYTVDNILQLNEDNGNLVFPLVEWGAGAYVKNRVIDLRYQYPWLKVSAIFAKILQGTGYTYSGSVFSEPRFLNSIMSLDIPAETNSEFLDENSAKLLAGYSNIITQQYVISGGAGSVFIPGSVFFTGPPLYRIIGTRPRYKFNLLNQFYAADYLGEVNEGSFIGSGFIVRDKTTNDNPDYEFTASGVKVYQSVIEHVVRITSRIFVRFTDEFTPPPALYTNQLNSVVIRVQKWGRAEDYYTLATLSVSDNPSDYDILELDFTMQAEENGLYYFVLESNVNFKIFPNRISGPTTQYSWFKIESLASSSIGSEFKMNSYIPNMKAKDFIKGIANMFGCNININRKDLQFKMFKEIATAEVEDWSDKFDSSKPWEINPRFGQYAQENFLKYQNDGTNLGNHVIGINDYILPRQNDLFVLPWAASNSYINMVDSIGMPVNGNTGIRIDGLKLFDAPEWEVDTTYQEGDIVQYSGRVWITDSEVVEDIPRAESPSWALYVTQFEPGNEYKHRIALVRFVSDTDTSNLVYHDGTYISGDPAGLVNVQKTKALMAYFIDPVQQEYGRGDMNLESIAADYYKEFSRMLQRGKSVLCYLYLTKADIRNLNFDTPKHVRFFGNNFYLNEVIQYQEGKSTQVNLIRM